MRSRTIHCLLAAFMALTSAGVTIGCGDTGEERVTFQMLASAPAGMKDTFTNDMGWTINLESAWVVVGPVYFFSGEPLFSLRRILDWFDPIPKAMAHPGHYVAGEALGQVLGSAKVELLAVEPEPLGSGTGVTGTYNSARVFLSPKDGGASVFVKGIATKDDTEIDFKGELDVEVKLEGLPCGIEMTAGRPGSLVLHVDPRVWLKRVEFSKLAGPDQDGMYYFEEGSSSHSAFVRGVDNAGAFSFSWKGE